MKKMKYLVLLWMSLFLLGSCSSGDSEEPIQPEEKPQIEISSSLSSPVLEQQGGTATVPFSSTAAWTAEVVDTRAESWCTVSPVSGGAGNAVLTVTAKPNDTHDERRATVTLRAGAASKNFTVVQKQLDALTVTSNKVEISAEGGNIQVEVKANVQYQYDIEEAARNWISEVTETRSLSSSILKFRVAENGDLEKRQGNIILRSGELTETVTVYQEGAIPAIILTKNEYTIESDGGTIQVELKSNIDYEVQLPVDGWIVENKTRAFSSHTHYFNVAANDSYDARTAEIIFINKDDGIEEKVKIVQAQRDAIIVAQEKYEISAEGGTLDIELQTNVDFTVSASVDWIQQVNTRGLSSKVLRFSIAANNLDDPREGLITVACGEQQRIIKVIQQAKAVFSISQKEFSVDSDGNEIRFEVITNGEYTIQLPDIDWLSEVSSRGTSSYVHTFAVAANPTYDSRIAEILITDKGSGKMEKVKVVQAQRDAIIVAQEKYEISAEGGTLDIELQTNVDFTVSASVDWIQQVSTRGLSSKVLRFSIAANETKDGRNGNVTLTGNNVSQVITIKQNGDSSVDGGIDDMPVQPW